MSEKIEIPVIQMQDLEHQPAHVSRVSNAGLEIQPPEEDLDETLALIERLERHIASHAAR